jgi:hypothetical protein
MSQEQPPPLPDGRGGWIHDTPRPTPPPPPRRTDRPRVIGDVGQAVAIESGLGDLNTAVRKLKQAGLSWDEIELAFFEAMKEEFGK